MFMKQVGTQPLRVADDATTGPQLFEKPNLDPEVEYGIAWKLNGRANHTSFQMEVYVFDEVPGDEATDDRMIDIRLHAAKGDSPVDTGEGGIGATVWFERSGQVFADGQHGTLRSQDALAQAELAELCDYLGLTEQDMYGSEERPRHGYYGEYDAEKVTRLGIAFDRLTQDRELLGVGF